MDMRPTLYENIVLCGGSTLFKGVASAFVAIPHSSKVLQQARLLCTLPAPIK